MKFFTKTRTDAPRWFFSTEARGLDWLREVKNGPPLPEVIDVDDASITLTLIEEGSPSPSAADDLGRALATMHAGGAIAFGADWPGFIGPLPMHNTRGDCWPAWYADNRVLPFLRQAVDRGSVSTAGARVIERACAQLPDVDEPPSRIHGDLWSGNLMWATDGRCWLIDPAAHGGHRETDLAMLALFGAPHLDRIIAAYDEAWPIADGWRQRVGIHQLHPLLVHAVLFGSGYGDRAVAAASK